MLHPSSQAEQRRRLRLPHRESPVLSSVSASAAIGFLALLRLTLSCDITQPLLPVAIPSSPFGSYQGYWEAKAKGKHQDDMKLEQRRITRSFGSLKFET